MHLHEDDGDSSGSGSVTAAPTPAGVVKLGKGHTCTCCLSQASMLLNLLDAQARSAIAHAVGETRPLSGRFGVQVALRFPLAPFGQGVADGDDALPAMLAAAGLDWHTDAAKYNDKKSFDVVVGVFLSDVLRPSDGALFVRPGSHVRERAARVEGRLGSRLHCAEADTSTQFSTADDCVVTSDGASSPRAPSCVRPVASSSLTRISSMLAAPTLHRASDTLCTRACGSRRRTTHIFCATVRQSSPAEAHRHAPRLVGCSFFFYIFGKKETAAPAKI